MKKRLGIVGVGSAGLVSLAHLSVWLDNSWEITSIYDPKMDTLGIGESTNANFVIALEQLGFTFEENLDELDGTLKFGTKFINWRKDTWINPLIEGAVAIHFNTFKLKDFVIPRVQKMFPEKFKTLEGTVTDITQDEDSVQVIVDDNLHVFDYIIDCRGFPDDFTDYTLSDCSLVNHCLVYDNPKFNPVQYTEHYATSNGWMFGVPLSTRMSYGYLYNDTITTKEDAISDMAKTLKIAKSKLKTREYSFKPYYANTIFDGRILKNGNRALFFEPISATSIYMYVRIAKAFYEFAIGHYYRLDVNQAVRNDLEDLENVIRYYYHGGSIYNTEFWQQAKTNATNQLKVNSKFFKFVNEMRQLATVERTPYKHAGMIFGAISWRKIDENFEYNYFTGNGQLDFDIPTVKSHELAIQNRNLTEVKQNLNQKNQTIFNTIGYVHLKKVLDPATVKLVTTYALNDCVSNFNPESVNAQIPGTHSKYADPLMEAILEKLHPIMEAATGLTLYPTYSYYRVYKPGDILHPHKDRPSCEISTTVCFNFDYKELTGQYNWPIVMEGVECVMEPGDIVVYHGCDLQHWRDEFKAPEGSWHVQAFCHYVNANGPYAGYKFDRRPHLGYRLNAVDDVRPGTQLALSDKKYISYTE